MTTVVIDAVMMNKLHQLAAPLELRDPSGRVLARVFPAADLSDCEPLTPQASEAELDGREQANEKRFMISEVLAHLEKLR